MLNLSNVLINRLPLNNKTPTCAGALLNHLNLIIMKKTKGEPLVITIQSYDLLAALCFWLFCFYPFIKFLIPALHCGVLSNHLPFG